MTLPPVPRPPTESAAPSSAALSPVGRSSRGLVGALLATAALSALLAVGLVVVSAIAVAKDDATDLSAIEDTLEDLSESQGAFPGEEDWYEYEEELYGFEDDYVVEDDDVLDATEEACEDLQSTAAALPLLSGEDPTAALTAVRDAVTSIVAALDGVEDLDSDSDEWRGDLVLLQEQLAEAVVALSEGRPVELDFEAGDDIGYRMAWGSPVGCEPPLRLLALDPDYPLFGETYSYAS